eukprot:s57_g36.t1
MEFCPPDAEEDERMMSAARNNDTVGLEQLLKRPRNPTVHDEHGLTALHHAAERGHLEPMRLLLEAGAEIDAERTKHWGKYAALHAAAEGGHLEAVRFLVENGAEKDQTDAFGRTIMQLATDHGHLEVTRFLVEVGADKSWLLTDGTALHTAAQNGHLEMVRFLVEVGCDKEQADLLFEMTPLMSAAWAGHLDVVRFLVESGANRHSTDEAGKTALDLASLYGRAEVVGFLSEHAAESPLKKVRRVYSPDRH